MTCTAADHDRVRDYLRRLFAGDVVDVTIDDVIRVRTWERSQREWLDADLIIGECACHSTLAIEKGYEHVTVH